MSAIADPAYNPLVKGTHSCAVRNCKRVNVAPVGKPEKWMFSCKVDSAECLGSEENAVDDNWIKFSDAKKVLDTLREQLRTAVIAQESSGKAVALATANANAARGEKQAVDEEIKAARSELEKQTSALAAAKAEYDGAIASLTLSEQKKLEMEVKRLQEAHKAELAAKLLEAQTAADRIKGDALAAQLADLSAKITAAEKSLATEREGRANNADVAAAASAAKNAALAEKERALTALREDSARLLREQADAAKRQGEDALRAAVDAADAARKAALNAKNAESRAAAAQKEQELTELRGQIQRLQNAAAAAAAAHSSALKAKNTESRAAAELKAAETEQTLAGLREAMEAAAAAAAAAAAKAVETNEARFATLTESKGREIAAAGAALESAMTKEAETRAELTRLNLESNDTIKELETANRNITKAKNAALASDSKTMAAFELLKKAYKNQLERLLRQIRDQASGTFIYNVNPRDLDAIIAGITAQIGAINDATPQTIDASIRSATPILTAYYKEADKAYSEQADDKGARNSTRDANYAALEGGKRKTRKRKAPKRKQTKKRNLRKRK